MQISPSLVRQPGWIPGAAGVLTALLTGSPHAQVDEVGLVGPTKYLNNAKAVVIHIDDSTTLVVDSFTLTNSRTGFTESYPRRRRVVDSPSENGVRKMSSKNRGLSRRVFVSSGVAASVHFWVPKPVTG